VWGGGQIFQISINLRLSLKRSLFTRWCHYSVYIPRVWTQHFPPTDKRKNAEKYSQWSLW